MFNDEDWDLGTCLKNECYRKQLRVPHPLRSWTDLRATYKVCIQLFRERLSEKRCTRQSRKVIWDMINTLFLMTVVVEPTFVAFL